jgi:hypothetical protein
MKNRNRLFTAILLALGCFALSPATQAAPPPPSPTNVNVVNTPNVNVANTTASPVLVRDVDNPARQPFQAEVVGGFADGASTTGDITIATVPAGKLLIIEHVGVFGAMLTGQSIARVTYIHVVDGRHYKIYPLVLRQAHSADGTRDYFVVSEALRVYANPGAIQCSAERDSFAGANPDSVTFTISGYFVDCPTCQ